MTKHLNATIVGCVLGLALLASSLGVQAAAENPFEQVAQQSYIGRFSGPEVDLRILKDEAEKWTGTLVFHGKAYDLHARKGASGLEGKFAQGDKSWPFTAVAEGDTLNFTTEGVSTKLQRRKLPKLEGRWRSERVLVIFGASTNGTTGQIQFNGQDYIFEAQEKAGDLEGMFKAGDKIFPFSIANEARGLVFKTGSFSEALAEVPKIARLKIITNPETELKVTWAGTPAELKEGAYELSSLKDAELSVQAEGFETVQTNLTLAPYSDTRLELALERARRFKHLVGRWDFMHKGVSANYKQRTNVYEFSEPTPGQLALNHYHDLSIFALGAFYQRYECTYPPGEVIHYTEGSHKKFLKTKASTNTMKGKFTLEISPTPVTNSFSLVQRVTYEQGGTTSYQWFFVLDSTGTRLIRFLQNSVATVNSFPSLVTDESMITPERIQKCIEMHKPGVETYAVKVSP